MTKELSLRIVGLAPLLMQNGRLANPLDPIAKQIKAITSRRKKTDEDMETLLALKFEGSLYWAEKTGPYMPAENLERATFDASKELKLGKVFPGATSIVQNILPLIYDGPREPKKLYQNLDFVDVRMVMVGRARIQTCRPIFKRWALEATLAYDPELIDLQQVQDVIARAGRQGLGTFRRRFGKFKTEIIK